MVRPARLVGFAPAGFLAVAAVLAAMTVMGGWTVRDDARDAGYGITADTVMDVAGETAR
jgi:hypothetical protein